ncbi:hypothetical protein Anapl_05359 [Anas platyrhynchos]|uniref:Uncharacterized protein n=1 Tax=Anas platyrhynchos TaxID=8839 RepID=R0LMP8_ANAPL|nr:hypothetical protein Anapl_05359 [Anas platyrhynchos]
MTILPRNNEKRMREQNLLQCSNIRKCSKSIPLEKALMEKLNRTGPKEAPFSTSLLNISCELLITALNIFSKKLQTVKKADNSSTFPALAPSISPTGSEPQGSAVPPQQANCQHQEDTEDNVALSKEDREAPDLAGALAACDASPPKPSCPYGEISLHLLGGDQLSAEHKFQPEFGALQIAFQFSE